MGRYSIGGDRPAFIILPHDKVVPRMLAPGEYLTDYTQDLSVFDRPVKFLSARDSLRRTYLCSRRDLKRILEEVRRARGSQARRQRP